MRRNPDDLSCPRVPSQQLLPRGNGDGHDNASDESVIGTIKRELVQSGCFEGIDNYNTRRKHSSIGYITPNECEKRLIELTVY